MMKKRKKRKKPIGRPEKIIPLIHGPFESVIKALVRPLKEPTKPVRS